MHRIAIAGFRHGHIFDLHQRALDHPDLELAATCEENYEASLMPAKGLSPDFTSFEKLLAETDCDIIALGDTYGRRGAQAIAALKAGNLYAPRSMNSTKSRRSPSHPACMSA